ncbi:MAG: hypothetical protein GY884_34835 [Proteobacteria bacterium]|nr:hypothetical protein [Pseudomonadota bacterium]
MPAPKADNKALAKAMGEGPDKLSNNQLKGALQAAANKLGRVEKGAQLIKENIGSTATCAVHATESAGSVFLASMAEGYFGKDKMKVGGIDVRAGGLVLQAGGLIDMLTGGKHGGSHFVALGSGVTGSWLASLGQEAGQALAQKRAAAVQPEPQPQITQTAGPIREVLLTEPIPQPATQGAGPRFVPAAPL